MRGSMDRPVQQAGSRDRTRMDTRTDNPARGSCVHSIRPRASRCDARRTACLRLSPLTPLLRVKTVPSVTSAHPQTGCDAATHLKNALAFDIDETTHTLAQPARDVSLLFVGHA